MPKYLTPHEEAEIIAGILRQAESDIVMHSFNAKAARLDKNNDAAKEFDRLTNDAKARIKAIEKDSPEAVEMVVAATEARAIAQEQEAARVAEAVEAAKAEAAAASEADEAETDESTTDSEG